MDRRDGDRRFLNEGGGEMTLAFATEKHAKHFANGRRVEIAPGQFVRLSKQQKRKRSGTHVTVWPNLTLLWAVT